MRAKKMAKELRGNWKKFGDFAWFDKPEDADNWCIVYTSNRDSGLIEQSNAAYYVKQLGPLVDGDEGDILEMHDTHWAVGYVDGWAIRVNNSVGHLTPAFLKYCELKEKEEDCVFLDEEDYEVRVREEALINLEYYVRHGGVAFTLKEDLPDNWVAVLHTELLCTECDTDCYDQSDLERLLGKLGFLDVGQSSDQEKE